MVDCHGSQCGFCTPGFVMSLFVLFKNYAKPNRNQILESLAGNLCRCTGYKPIIDAALQLHKYSKKDGFDAKKTLKLLSSFKKFLVSLIFVVLSWTSTMLSVYSDIQAEK